MKLVAGAYAASPTLHSWNPSLESTYLSRVAAIPELDGLEIPWSGAVHPHDPEWLLANLPRGLDLVVTAIPGTVGRLAADPTFGLASHNAAGRADAVQFAARLRDDVHRLVDAGRVAHVIAVEVHSAPLRSAGGVAEFADSLGQLSEWDWAGASLVVEHCDALVVGQSPAKGYLTLEEEIEAARQSGVGVSLNWGRSAIELRDGDAVVEHTRLARESGLLRGVIFSGASGRDGRLGGAWEDRHHPLDDASSPLWGDPTSLLTRDRLRATLAASGPLDWVGLKFGWSDQVGPDSVPMLEEGVQILREET